MPSRFPTVKPLKFRHLSDGIRLKFLNATLGVQMLTKV
nr:MAG TPA: hypothetical protein [Caudoviricetes sp.]